ncbi:MAG: S-layer protein, partial [Candidatus Diapherotrites archaeon]|nr:S-layer protein [Candidatus Diapherotrites archaeon]
MNNMRSMNVKKLAALAVGALFAGQAAAAGLVADTLPTDKTWYLNSAIVIGAKAQPADVVWAGNIAAAIGNMAYVEETKTVELSPENVKVKL